MTDTMHDRLAAIFAAIAEAVGREPMAARTEQGRQPVKHARLSDYSGRIRHFDSEYPNRPLSVTLDDIDQQRRDGWPDWHPESYCHRCGYPNQSWVTSRTIWDAVMRRDGPFGPWQEIICIPCFIELAESAGGPRSWRITRHPDYGSVQLTTGGDQ